MSDSWSKEVCTVSACITPYNYIKVPLRFFCNINPRRVKGKQRRTCRKHKNDLSQILFTTQKSSCYLLDLCVCIHWTINIYQVYNLQKKLVLMLELIEIINYPVISFKNRISANFCIFMTWEGYPSKEGSDPLH
ncbi:unnamed protein product [Moneuplotes crassus]|uniref:Uncharacterized protein n=1 Tax=Euplotes crassus TaxID=5936 RepID=A0AAD1XLW8_EUPCR|nr:unnamed protein product [Moneuplotes crassus]